MYCRFCVIIHFIKKGLKMYQERHDAFTMLELVFVVVLIGILSALAIPKFAHSRADAIITKAKTQVASIRSAMATERQKRMLKGDFKKISSLHNGKTYIFNAFDGNTSNKVLEYPPLQCKDGETACWKYVDGKYQFVMPVSGRVNFTIKNSRFFINLELFDAIRK